MLGVAHLHTAVVLLWGWGGHLALVAMCACMQARASMHPQFPSPPGSRALAPHPVIGKWGARAGDGAGEPSHKCCCPGAWPWPSRSELPRLHTSPARTAPCWPSARPRPRWRSTARCTTHTARRAQTPRPRCQARPSGPAGTTHTYTYTQQARPWVMQVLRRQQRRTCPHVLPIACPPGLSTCTTLSVVPVKHGSRCESQATVPRVPQIYVHAPANSLSPHPQIPPPLKFP